MKITLKDIAREAGVSYHSVSKVLNNRNSYVSRKTRDAILAIAKKYNYQPNFMARSLKGGRTNCIGLMGSLNTIDFGNYFFSRTTMGIEGALAKDDSAYSLLIFGNNYRETYDRSLTLIRQSMVDGLILIIFSEDLELFNNELKPLLKGIGLPFVVIHSTSGPLTDHNVGMDSRRAGYLAGEHLIRRGYDDIGFFLLQQDSIHIHQALEGFKTAFKESGRAWRDEFVIHPLYPEDPYKDLYQWTLESVKGIKDFPRAVFVPRDRAALGLMKGLAEKGLRVPEDVAIVGMDDEISEPYFNPELTTIHHPFEEKGAAALKMLTSILGEKTDTAEIRQEILEPYLVVRKSCGSNGK